MSLTTSAVTLRAPERRAQELLNEWLKLYFTGTPHLAPSGDATFPLCDLLFNQADLPSPVENPQLHTVFTDWRATEQWWAASNLSTWVATLAVPASGVRYGRTTDGFIEESVHGKQVRRLRGSDIRWRNDGTDYVEEVFNAIAST